MHKDTEAEIRALIRAESVMVVDTVGALKGMTGTATGLVFLKGKSALADGLGGMYYFDAASTDADDTVYLNTVAPTAGAGRWKRLNQRVTVLPGGGILVANAGVKTLYTSATVAGTEGKATVYATADGTATGTAIFTEIWQNAPSVKPPAAQALIEDNVNVSPQTESGDLKTLVYVATRGAKTTLPALATALLGLVIVPLRYAPAGTVLRIAISGI